MNAFVVGVATYQAPLVSAVGFGVAFSGLIVYFILVYPKKLPNFLITIDRMCHFLTPLKYNPEFPYFRSSPQVLPNPLCGHA